MSNQYGLPPQQRQQQPWPAQPPQYTQQQPPGGYQYPPPGYQQQTWQQPPRPAPRKRRRVFLWVFLGVQALFILWLVVGLATVHTGPTHAQLVQGCYHHAWWPLYKSQADCITHYGRALNDAGTVGKGLGAAVIIVFWMVVDVILGISYGVYRLATRDRR